MNNFFLLLTITFCLTSTIETTAQNKERITFHPEIKKAYILIDSMKTEQAIQIAKKTMEANFRKNDTLTAELHALHGNIYMKKKKYKEAIEEYNSAINFWEQLTDSSFQDQFHLYNQVGLCYFHNGEYNNAIQSFINSLNYSNKTFGPKSNESSYSLNNLSSAYLRNGNFDQAINVSKKSLSLDILNHHEKHPLVADNYNNLANIYRNKGEFDSALNNIKKAIEIRTKHFGPDHNKIADTYQTIGNIYNNMGKFEKAATNYENSLEIYYKNFDENEIKIYFLFGNIAIIHSQRKNLQKAIMYYHRSLAGFKKFFGEKHRNIAIILMNLGTTYINTGENKNAVISLEEALDILIHNFDENHNDVALCYSNLGSAYASLNKYELAMSYHQKGLIIRTNLFGEKSMGVANSQNLIGNTYFYMGEYTSAIEHLKRAIHIRQDVAAPTHVEFSSDYASLARVYHSIGRYEKAIEFYEKSYEIRSLNFPEGHPIMARDLGRIGQLYSLKNQTKKANIYFEKSITLFEKLQIEKINNDLSYSFLFNNLFIFESYIKNIFKIDKNKAYLYLEKAKSNLTLAALRKAKATQFYNLPDSLIEQEIDINYKITSLEKNRQKKIENGQEETDLPLLELHNKIFELQIKKEQLNNYLKNNYPQFYNAQYSLIPISKSTVQNELLNPNQSLIEYLLGDSSLFIFLVKKDTFIVKEIKNNFGLDNLVNTITKEGIYGYYALPQSKQSRKKLEQSIVNYTEAAHKLFEKLIAPIKNELTKDLIIVPDGVLGYVPFEALLSEQPERLADFKNYPFLIRDHQISYCYSATLLKEMRDKQHNEKTSNNLLAMAPFFSGDIDSLVARYDSTDILMEVALRDSLGSLPASGEEVAKINTLWKGLVQYGENASLKSFEQNANQYCILHLSTHGKADDRVGDYAYLAFGVPDDKGAFDKLYARDLYNYSLNADMVVLSACETGIGQLQKGEGIISLARAFAYAGAKSIFTTLWKVSDEKTKDLTVDFYAFLKMGKTKDEALRLAKLKYLKDNETNGLKGHPFFWAGMIGIGDMRSFKF